MLELLHRADHLPGCGKDGLIALLLPEINIKLAVRRLPADDSSPEFSLLSALPRSFVSVVHNSSGPLFHCLILAPAG
jgi:hypothetical protein